MKGKWKVSSQVLNDQWHYIVVRVKNINEPEHSGNREFAMDEYITDKEKCKELADHLNNKTEI